MRALWAVCMLGAGLAACGEGEVAPPAPSTDSTTESAPSPPSPPSPQRDPALLEAARSARGSGFAARFGSHRADDPATHFQLSGEARFAFRDPALEDRSFAFEVALAGPSVQRYQLSAGQRKNWFLLAGPGDCWVKTPEDQQPKPASARAGELGEDAALRWLILGFPAHLEGAAAQQRARDWSEAWEAEQPIALPEDFGQGGLQISMGEDGLPTRVERVDAEGTRELLLEVTDWSLSAGAATPDAPLGLRYPRSWSWHREDWILHETLDRLEDHALYLDTAFRPEEAPLARFQVRRAPDGSSQRVPEDRFALIEHTMRYRVLEAAPEDPTEGNWEFRAPTETRWAEQLDAKAEGPGVESIEAQLCLLWSSPRLQAPTEEGLQRLREVAAQNGLEVIGPVWIHTGVVGLELLLPVRKPD
ncbi:MAG: hypothetical protein CMJ94_15700 [Planctomycetes bacterium]|nr:hypothetical protein [Planctomycetota bacterium]